MKTFWQAFAKKNNVRFDVATTVLLATFGSVACFENNSFTFFSIHCFATLDTAGSSKVAMTFYYLLWWNVGKKL